MSSLGRHNFQPPRRSYKTIHEIIYPTSETINIAVIRITYKYYNHDEGESVLQRLSSVRRKKEEKEKRGEKRVLRRRDLREPIKPFCLGFSRFWKQPMRRKNSISVTGIYEDRRTREDPEHSQRHKNTTFYSHLLTRNLLRSSGNEEDFVERRRFSKRSGEAKKGGKGWKGGNRVDAKRRSYRGWRGRER